jgi:hypothetical protein
MLKRALSSDWKGGQASADLSSDLKGGQASADLSSDLKGGQAPTDLSSDTRDDQARLKPADFSLIMETESPTVVWPISVGAPYFTKNNAIAALSLIINIHEKRRLDGLSGLQLKIILGDTLQRHNKCYEQGVSLASARAELLNQSNEWKTLLEKYAPVLNDAKLQFTTYTWDEITDHHENCTPPLDEDEDEYALSFDGEEYLSSSSSEPGTPPYGSITSGSTITSASENESRGCYQDDYNAILELYKTNFEFQQTVLEDTKRYISSAIKKYITANVYMEGIVTTQNIIKNLNAIVNFIKDQLAGQGELIDPIYTSQEAQAALLVSIEYNLNRTPELLDQLRELSQSGNNNSISSIQLAELAIHVYCRYTASQAYLLEEAGIAQTIQRMGTDNFVCYPSGSKTPGMFAWLFANIPSESRTKWINYDIKRKTNGIEAPKGSRQQLNKQVELRKAEPDRETRPFSPNTIVNEAVKILFYGDIQCTDQQSRLLLFAFNFNFNVIPRHPSSLRHSTSNLGNFNGAQENSNPLHFFNPHSRSCSALADLDKDGSSNNGQITVSNKTAKGASNSNTGWTL